MSCHLVPTFILVFFSSSLFSGVPRREKEKEKEKPVQPFVRPRTKIGLTTGSVKSELTVGSLKGALTRGDGPFWYPPLGPRKTSWVSYPMENKEIQFCLYLIFSRKKNNSDIFALHFLIKITFIKKAWQIFCAAT
jgi:hypothetical protein